MHKVSVIQQTHVLDVKGFHRLLGGNEITVVAAVTHSRNIKSEIQNHRNEPSGPLHMLLFFFGGNIWSIHSPFRK